MFCDCTTIRPQVGLGDLNFGALQDDVRAYRGEPGRIEEPEEPLSWSTWNYPAIGLQVNFDTEMAYRLLAVSITDPGATLCGRRLIGLSRKAALRAASEIGLGPYMAEIDALGWEAVFDQIDLEFRIDGDLLWLISWSVFIDYEDMVHWPE